MPHHHDHDYEEHSQRVDIKDFESWKDYLEFVFHVDMGEGHLETFDQGRGLDFDLKYTSTIGEIFTINYYSYFHLQIDNNYCAHTFNIDKVPIVKRQFNTSIQFRGPPSPILS